MWNFQIPEATPLEVAMETIASCIPDEILSGDGLESLLVRTRNLPVSALDDFRTCCDPTVSVFPEGRFAQYLIERGRRESATPAEAGLGWYLSEVGRPESFLMKKALDPDSVLAGGER